MTITSYDAEKDLVSGPVADTVLDRLEGTGVVGLSLAVGPLRRPFAAGEPLLGPEDWQGARFRAFNSPVQADTITALGGEPVNIGTGWLDEAAAGNMRGIEFDIPQYYNNGLTTEAGNVTSNVVLWPKVYVLSLSQDTFDGLTEEQQGWVREAAEQATQTSVEATYDETTLARELCETGTRFIPASDEQLDALHAAVAPVIDGLAADPDNTDLLTDIQAIAAEYPDTDIPDVPDSCQLPATAETSESSSTAPGEVMSTEVTGTALPAGSAPASAAATIPLSELEGRIVFTRWGGFNNGFFIANADGSDEQRLVAIPTGELCCLVVAADGSRASIPARSSGGRYSVEVVNLADLSTVVLDPLSETLDTIGGPFSPDGTQIAYNMEPRIEPGINVYIGPSDDPSDAMQIIPTEPLPADIGLVYAIDYSPDGRQLVLYQPAPDDTGNIHGSLAIINVDGSGFHALTPEGLDLPCCGQWSPDGTSIVFADSDGRLLTISPDGSGLTEVYSEADTWAFQPNWSPDGSQIIFSLNSSADPNDPAPNGLYVINPDGTGLTPVITTPDHKTEAFWVPDIR